MKIKVLGTRGEIKSSAPHHRKQSGVLLDNKILLDIGDESFLAYHPEYILITHLHPDHAYFVRHGESPTIAAKIYAPEPYKNMPIHIPPADFTLNDYTVQTIPTIHSIKVKSNAYLITYHNKKILYTGDMIWIESKYHHLLHDIDLVITEASHIKTGGMVRRQPETGALFGHTGIPNLIHLFKSSTRCILFIHFGSWFFNDIPAARKEFNKLEQESGIKLIVGYDGLELTI